MSRLLIILFFLLSAFSIKAYPDYEVFTVDGKQGLKNQAGEILIPAQFETLGWSFSEGAVRNNRIGFKKNDKWGVVSIDNKILFPATLDGVYDATASVIISGKKQINGRYKKGLINYEGKVLIPHKFNDLEVYGTQVKALQDGHYGVLDFEGKEVIKFDYTSIKNVSDLRWMVVDSIGKGALYNSSGQPLTGFVFDDLGSFENNMSIAHVDHFKGLLNNDGKWILDPQYKNIELTNDKAVGVPYNKFYFYTKKSTHQWSVDSVHVHDRFMQFFASGKTWLTNYSNEIVFGRVDQLTLSGDYAIIKNNGFTDVYDMGSNKYLIKSSPDQINFLNQHLLVSRKRNTQHLKNIHLLSSGKIIIQNIQEHIVNVEGIYYKKNDAWGFLDPTGKEVLPAVFDKIHSYKSGKFIVTFHGDHGIIDNEENWLVVPGKHEILQMNDKVYITKGYGLYNIYSYSGKRLYFTPYLLTLKVDYVKEHVDPFHYNRIGFDGRSINTSIKKKNYEEILPLSEGLIGILRDGQYGFIDPQGRLRVSNRYEGIQIFSEGFASIKLLGKWGVIDKQERLVVQPTFDSVSHFSNGTAIVRKENKYGIINNKGDVVLPINQEGIKVLDDRYYLLLQNGRYGIAQKNGKVIIWPKYDEILLSNNFFIVSKDGLVGLHDLEGLAVLPPAYKAVIPLPNGSDILLGKEGENVVVPIK